ncbi:type II toxin-antitoxin system VapC family toxin [Novosphingobium sp. Gsoil 351]|uniref:type II toxin-antitoxin system VapC family toxin n=1 Tax=Novosphingobium sp. Gsoil 351 TaxID=2675225 RepID=UPI0012B45722|nr:hypothetical protein [Novosphingobium sp. Gsoil 351]QGN54750.1 hypothetical protein GKE62_09480 [Novosphingobium sp. Gsoil 351]
MQLLLDTHIVVSIVLNDRRLSAMQREALGKPYNEILVSPIIAYELTHLHRTRRIPLAESMDQL